MDPKLQIRIGADTADVDRAFQRIGGSATKLTEQISRIGAGGLAGALSLTGLTAFLSKTVNGIDALNDLSDATGSSIERLSALEGVALRTGNSFSSVQTSLVRFNGVLKEADGKNGISQALQSIGLNVAELKRLDPADALAKTAAALAGYADDGQKARLVQELFGKSVAEVAPLLKDLAEQGLGVATVTTQQAKEAERYKKELAQLGERVTTLARDITSRLIPALSDTFKVGREGGLLAGLDRFLGFDKATFDLNVLKRDSAAASAEVERVTNVLVGLSATLERDPGNENAQRRYDKLSKKLKELHAQAGKANEALKLAVVDYDPREQPAIEDALTRRLARGEDKPTIKFDPSKVGDRSPRKRPEDTLGSFITDQLNAQQKRDDALAKRDEEELQRRLDRANEFGLQLTDQTAQLTAELITDERARADVLIEIDRRRLQEQLDGTGVAGDRRLELLADIDKNIVARQALLTEQLKPEWERMLAAWADTVGSMKRFGDDFMGGFLRTGQQTWQDWAVSGKLSTRSLTDFIKSEFARLAYEQYLAQHTASLGKTILGGIIGGLGALTGNRTGSDPNGYNGTQNNPSAYVAPKLETGTNYVPHDGFKAELHEGEAVVPKKYNPAAGGQAGGNITVNQTLNIGQGVTRAEVYAAARQSRAELMEELRRSRTRGGFFEP